MWKAVEQEKKMKRAGIFLWMMIKRMGKHPVYWILLLLFPAALFIVPKFNMTAGEEKILVGYVLEEAVSLQSETESGQLLKGIEFKLSEGENLFRYTKYINTAELKEDILTGEISCGIVFDQDFTRMLKEQDYRHCITLYLPEGMNVGGMVQEDVFQRVYQVYSAVWYADLLEQQGYQITPEEVLQKFSEYQKEGKVFTVSYEVQKKEDEKIQNVAESASILSLRGILAFLTLMSASLGALDRSRDRKRGVGKGISHPKNLAVIAVGAPILPATLLLAVGMLLANAKMTNVSYCKFGKLIGIEWFLAELSVAFLYGVVLWLLAIFFSRLLPEKLLEGIMPCFLLLVLLCCPIFLNLGETIPLIGYLSKLFPVTWYLEFWG